MASEDSVNLSGSADDYLAITDSQLLRLRPFLLIVRTGRIVTDRDCRSSGR